MDIVNRLGNIILLTTQQFTNTCTLQFHYVLQGTIFFFGSKQHITSQCIYFAFRTIILFGVLFPKKTCFPQKEFSNEMLWNFLYIVFIVGPICHIFFTIKFGEIRIFESAQILPILCFILKKFHNFKSYPKHVNTFKFYF